MTKRQAATPAPGPLETYTTEFDDLFERRNAREAFRRYLEGLLLPAERNKTLTALANAEPIVGIHAPRVQSLQWFLSESTWDAAALNARRVELLRQDPATAPDEGGVLVIDETGDRKWGSKTAHIGRQYLGSIGKVDSGIVSVSALWADDRVYWPLSVEPFTPKHHFARGMNDPAYRTKPQIAVELVQQAVADGLPFRAVVADSFYGENETFRTGLVQLGVGYVLALRPSHAWWALVDQINSLHEAARTARWAGPAAPGDWHVVERRFRDGHTEVWWALEIRVGPYGPHRRERAVVATTDPAMLPEHTTWYLLTNLPASASDRASQVNLPAADLTEIVRLYGLRNWVEQSYKQIKAALGWSTYQVRSDRAIRRHWALVWCAFSFCWWTAGEVALADSPGQPPPPRVLDEEPPARGENQPRVTPGTSARGDMADATATGARLVGTLGHAQALLARLVHTAPAVTTPGAPRCARTRTADRPLC